MKKLLTIVLAMLMLLSLSGCSGGTKKFDKWVPKGISFYMTLEEVEEVLGDYYEIIYSKGKKKVIKYYDSDVYRFENGQLTSIRLDKRTSLAELMNKYGNPGNTSGDFYYWYGTLDGTDCYMCYEDNSISSLQGDIEFGISN